ncbi:MAG: hypothetical protein WD049_04285 [Candidatus Paceibacterota bacterium]
MSQQTISVIEEDLPITLPSERVRVVCAQPFISFREPVQEPFPISSECESRLLQGIDCVFGAARSYDPQFIVFPEFSIPGIAGVQRLKNAMLSAAISRSTVCVGGVTGLSVEDFASIANLNDVDVNVAGANAPINIPADFWINTSVTIVKSEDGIVMWLQPKLSPSWPESCDTHQRMFRGRALHLFRATFDDGLPCHFFSALCYDWIGRENGSTAPAILLERFNDTCSSRGGQQSLNWVFVLQHNRRPNDDTFLSAAREFLTDTMFPFVNRNDVAILMACTASSLTPTRNGDYGCSSVILGPRAPFDMRACPSTFTTSGARIRNSTALRTCKDAVFREMGECFHAFEIRNPRTVVPDPTDRTLPLEDASVFSFAGVSTDPRLPGAMVPAVVKWVNDELDQLSDLATDCLFECPLQAAVATSQAAIVSDHRSLPSQTVAEHIHFSKASAATLKESIDPASKADEWDQEERDGLEHVVHALAIVGSVESINVSRSCIHGRHESAGVEIAAIRGKKHSDCIEAFEKWSSKTHSPMVLISRDRHNTIPLQRELECFADPGHTAGVKMTSAQTLLVKARKFTREELESFTSELFDVSERRII